MPRLRYWGGEVNSSRDGGKNGGEPKDAIILGSADMDRRKYLLKILLADDKWGLEVLVPLLTKPIDRQNYGL
jgi:hypothetical protein